MAGGGAGGKEVGRLSIRVVPDMDGFQGEVKRKAEAAAAAANPEVNVGADTAEAHRKIDELKDERGRIDLDVDADTARAEARLAEASRERRAKIKVDVDEDNLGDMKRRLGLLSLEFERRVNSTLQKRTLDPLSFHGTRDKIGELDLGWERKMAEFRAAPLKDLEQRINLKPHLDESDLIEMKARLANENATMRVKVVMDDQNMQRMAHTFGRDVDAIFDRAEKRIAGGGGGGGGGRRGGFGGGLGKIDLLPNIGGLGGIPSLVLIISALSLLAPALSLVSQALVGLPALVAAVALPIGVFALGMGGIKKALDESGLMDLVTGKKGKQTQGMGAGLKEMQKQVSDVFEVGFKPLFTSFAGALPALTRGLPFVARGIVDLAGGLTKALVSPENIANFDRFTNSVSTMLTNLGPGLQSFTGGMLTLITNVGDHLPGLGNTMTEWAGRFNNWVTEISKPKQFWGNDVPNSSRLDQAVSNMKPILNSIINFVGTLMDKGIEMASSKGMTDGIVNTIDGFLGLIMRALPALRQTFDAIASGMKLFGVDTHGYESTKDHGNAPGSFWGMPAGAKGGDKPSDGGDGKPSWFSPGGAMSNFIDAVTRLPQNLLKDSGLDKPLGAIWNTLGMGQAAAAPSPFNAGGKAPGAPQAPVPVVPVGPSGGPPNASALFPGGAGNPLQPKPPSAFAGGGQGTIGTSQSVQAPKIEAPKLPPGSEKIWDPLIQSTQTAGAQIGAEVSSWEGKIKSALDSAASGANASGQAIGAQLAAGIGAGEHLAVDAAHHLADAVKGALPNSPAEHGPLSGSGWTDVLNSGGAIASQFADGLDGGFDGVKSASERLAQAVHDSMTNNGGILPPGLSAAVKRESSAIGIELDKLKQQKEALDPKDKSGRKAIQDQMKQLQELRTDLGLSDKQSKYDSKYGGAGGEGPFNQQNVGSMITQGLASALNAMVGFPKANLSQLEQDLGMSGNGVVEQLGDYGLNFLTGTLNSLVSGAFGGKGGGGGDTYNFHSMDDEGMQGNYARVKQRQTMQHTQRG